MTVITSSANQWFVEIDFGATLGPMPADALVEMARTQALLPRDRVREGAGGPWRLASEVPGLFDGNALLFDGPAARPGDPSLEAIPADPNGAANPSEVIQLRKPSAVDKESAPIGLDAPKPSPLRMPTKAELPADVIESTADPLRELLESWPTERVLQRGQSGVGSAHEECDFELDVPLVKNTVVSKPRSSPRSVDATESGPLQPSDPVPLPEPVTATTATEPTPPLDPPSRAPLPSHLTARGLSTHLQPRRRGRRLLISTVSATVFSAFVVTWWVWPRNRPDIYARYVAVYKEFQQRRQNISDQAGWNDFVAHARADIEGDLPWLETHARPGAREKCLLLYVGRDLHEMLGQRPESPCPHQERVETFLAELQSIESPSKSREQ